MKLANNEYSYIDMNGNSQAVKLNAAASAEIQSQFGDIQQWVQAAYHRYILRFNDISNSAFTKAVRLKAWRVYGANLGRDF